MHAFILFHIGLVISCLLIYIFVMLQVAALTLIERKVMGAIQRRKGPNVVGFAGLLQPIADGLKLASKEMILPTHSNHFLFFFAPVVTFFLSLISWSVIPLHSLGAMCNPNISLLLVLMISSLNVYGLLIGGWASNSKYALLGAIRTTAQMISYEVIFGFIIMPVIMFTGSTNLHEIGLLAASDNIFYMIKLFPLSILFLITILAETNRAPFDLPEAESELVAGYNVEYSSFIFALFFLGEYSSILLMSSLFVLLFGGSWSFFFFTGYFVLELLVFIIKLVCICYFFVWVRATFPRLRFDQLMNLCWKFVLPITFFFLLFYSFMFWLL